MILNYSTVHVPIYNYYKILHFFPQSTSVLKMFCIWRQNEREG